MEDRYYRHYKLYQYAFCKKNVADIKFRTVEEFIEKPPQTLALSTAMSEEDWNERIEIAQREKEKEALEKAEEALKGQDQEIQEREADEAQSTESQKDEKEGDTSSVSNDTNCRSGNASNQLDYQSHPICLDSCHSSKYCSTA